MTKKRSLLTTMLTLGILSVSVFSKLREKTKRKPKTEVANTESDEGEPEPQQPALQPVDQLVNTDTEAQNPERSKQDANDKHEKAGINWLAIQTIATIVFGVATIGVLIYHGVIFSRQQKATQGQLSAAKEQLAIAQKQFETADRPWLAVDIVPDGPLVFGKDSVDLSARFTVTNVGRSVATTTTINAQAFVLPPGGDLFRQSIERQKGLCENVNSKFMAYAIFPGGAYVLRQGFGIGRDEFERGRVGPTDFVAGIYIVGCVDYQFGGQPTHHQTGFIYEVHVRNMTNPNFYLAVKIGEDLPADRLIFQKSIMSGDYAN